MASLGQGGGQHVRFTLRGPAWLGPGGDWGTLYRAALQRVLTPVASDLKGTAQSAYAGTRFAAGFTYRTAWQPYAEVRLYQSDPIFPYVEYKTKPHIITAKNGGRLAFMYQGHLVRPRSVNHPGTKGKYLINPIMAQYEARFRAAIITAVREATLADA